CLLPKTWRQTIVSAHMIFAGSPFVRTSRLVIDMTMRKAKHLAPCSMRDLVMLQTIVRSQPHTPITHSDTPMRHNTTNKDKDAHTDHATAVIHYQQIGRAHV